MTLFKVIVLPDVQENNEIFKDLIQTVGKGGQWLSGRVLDSRPRAAGLSPGFEPHPRH